MEPEMCSRTRSREEAQLDDTSISPDEGTHHSKQAGYSIVSEPLRISRGVEFLRSVGGSDGRNIPSFCP
ncbi:hypothetical protein ACLOJK_019011 [Asimina triloba]